ncbi:hypothetical protein [Saccharopolyspora shandongensis]|uniref:hypothetical protein n=1 Tax=Saccharopolyspora shandongensis TaxID=418495 RepID=UPI0033E516C2
MALGRTKTSRRPQKPAEPAEPDHEFESYLAALAPEEDVESTGAGRRFGGSQVYQLRLPLMANERLRELAVKQGTSPAALARDWVMQHLAVVEAEQDPAGQAPGVQAPMGQAPDGYGHVWPGEETQQDFRPLPEYGDQAGYPGIEETDEITVPQKRFR